MRNKISNQHRSTEKDYHYHRNHMYRTSYKYRRGAPAVPLWFLLLSIFLFGGIVIFLIYLIIR